MHDVVDLRSDTLTLPTSAMRDAMARAEVGDDVWEEDPTVQRLEARAAALTAKDAALFVSSGTQGNLVSVLAQTHPGQEIVVDADCHIFNYEVAGAATLGGLQTRAIETERGFLTPDGLWLVSGDGHDETGPRRWSVVVKMLSPQDPNRPENDFFYWKREALVAQSGLTLTLPGRVRAPRRGP